jgi:2-phosphosulfolactate phosphatase
MIPPPHAHPRVLTEWGLNGLIALKPHVAVLVIVDVLSFCTAVDIAVSRGASIIPFPHGDESRAAEAARQAGALCATRRAHHGYSLSPHSLTTIELGTKLLLPSPNGATISLAAGTTPILAGCLRNATATAHAARTIAGTGGIGIIPAGERWPDRTIRPAIEDWLGAGAIIDALDLPLDPESETARASFHALHPKLPAIVAQSRSGQELITRGYQADITLATEHDSSSTACIMRAAGGYQRYSSNIQSKAQV